MIRTKKRRRKGIWWVLAAIGFKREEACKTMAESSSPFAKVFIKIQEKIWMLKIMAKIVMNTIGLDS